MKKILLVLFISLYLLPQSAHASSSVSLTATTYRHLDGTFFDAQLIKDLAPTGRLGLPIFSASSYISMWSIDPALIEDIQAVTQTGAGSEKDIALAWLAQLKKVTTGHRVQAIVYGNPSEYWITKFFPHDHEYFLTASATRLSALLGRTVEAPTQYFSHNYFSLTSSQVRLLQATQARTDASAAFLDSTQLAEYKFAEVKILNPNLNTQMRQTLAYDLAELINKLRSSVHTAPGKFTITSSKQKLPITVSNDFAQAITVDLIINSINEKVFVDDVKDLVVPGKSKIQVMIPVSVYTSGDSGFVITIKGRNGDVYGESTTYPLKVVVISPIATWITSAAAIVLFGAAIFQSLRRLKRTRRHHEHR